MDPLSVSASLLGVLGAAQQVSSFLITFTKGVRSAPKLAQIVLAEVTSTTAILSQLQTFLLGTVAASKAGASLILVEQVIVVLTECVKTFSELEDVLGTSEDAEQLHGMDRVKWALKEPKISSIQQRLQSNKINLTLMLTVLQYKAMEDARKAADSLFDRVGQVLSANEAMMNRLRAFDEPQVLASPPTAGRKSEDSASTTSDQNDIGSRQGRKDPVQRNALGFAFEEELLSSSVYKKPLFSQSGASLVTSSTRNTSASILSSLSISDVSNISILAVPIYANEISNSQRYKFGDFNPRTHHDGIARPSESSKSVSRTRRWDSFANTLRRRRLQDKETEEPKKEPVIFGVALNTSIKYANVAISLINERGESFIYGYIPILIAKVGVFLKEKGTEVENIFGTSGSPIRLKKVEDTFNYPPRYGKGFDWTGYTVHDAASILIRYLSRLPESVIPPSFYERYQEPLRYLSDSSMGRTENRHNHKMAIRSYQSLILELPPINRHLLLYLLDMLAVFADKSEINKMTARRLAIIFQPMILSPVQKDEENIEDPTYRNLSQAFLLFLIENQDHFLIGVGTGDEVMG